MWSYKFCFVFLFVLLQSAINSFAQNKSFNQLDSFAKHVPPESDTSVASLSSYFLSITNDKLELSRLAFSWVAFNIAYDDDSFNTGKYADFRPEFVLKKRKAVCAGYSELLTAICIAMDIPCVSINGFGKGYGFQNGMPVNGANHAWNAIQYDQQWHLMDVTWASGFAENVNGKAKSKFQFSDYWFDTNPNEFIFYHFPDSSQFQFLPKKYTREQFRKLILPSATCFFQFGFKVDSVLEMLAANPKLKLPEVFNPDAFNFKFTKIPITYNLNSNASYYFELIANPDAKFVLLNNNALIQFDTSDGIHLSKTVENLSPGLLQFGIDQGGTVQVLIVFKVIKN